jgi:hypothetical protein
MTARLGGQRIRRMTIATPSGMTRWCGGGDGTVMTLTPREMSLNSQ